VLTVLLVFASVSVVKFFLSLVFGLVRLCAFSVSNFSSARLGLDFSCVICSLVGFGLRRLATGIATQSQCFKIGVEHKKIWRWLILLIFRKF
jgi:hypothetical protein